MYCATTAKSHPTDPQQYRRVALSQRTIDVGFEALKSIMFTFHEGHSSVASDKGPVNIAGLEAIVTIADGLVRTVIGEQLEYNLGKISEANEL